MAGIILVLIGIGGSAVSLFWDVMYRGAPFSFQDIGPFNIAGIMAGLIILNAGIVAGFALARRKHPVPAGAFGPAPRAGNTGFLLSGVILTLSGLGGMVVSLFWDVISRGRQFSADAIGPFKLAGMLAGTALLAAGIVLFFLGRRRAPVRELKAAEPSQVIVTRQEDIPYAVAIPVGPAKLPAAGGQPMEAIPVEDPGPIGEDTTRR